jgi:aspartate aminotransferase
MYTKEELMEIGKCAVENDFYIVSDEIYENLVYGQFEHVSIGSLSEEIFERTITVNGWQKVTL